MDGGKYDMNIIIKGMDMPSCCGECRFLDDYGDYPCCIITDEQRGYNFRIREKRMDHCPLISFPSHGKLINVDAVKEWVENWFRMNRNYHPYAKLNNIPITELYDILERMPTIISADKENE